MRGAARSPASSAGQRSRERAASLAIRASAAGGDVGMLGREVGAELAALAGRLLQPLEGDVDLLAGGAPPHLEAALDVDLGDVVQGDAVVAGDHLPHAVVGE